MEASFIRIFRSRRSSIFRRQNDGVAAVYHSARTRELENTTTCVLFSSGTTGLPKGVRLSHWNLVSSNICSMESGDKYKARRAGEGRPFEWRTIACLPMAQIAGIQQYSINPFYKKELIKYKGLQVAPAELEDLLMSHPNIADAAVIGVQSKKHGAEVPKAFVLASRSIDVTTQEIVDFVKTNSSSHKQLRGGVEFVDEIPKSASGKILRKELRLRPYVEDQKAKL